MTQFTVCRGVLCYISNDENSTNHRPAFVRQCQRELRGVETDSSLRHVLDDALCARSGPDYSAMLVTGDLVQDDPSGYLRFKSIFGNLQNRCSAFPAITTSRMPCARA
jgi:hypothetical protein